MFGRLPAQIDPRSVLSFGIFESTGGVLGVLGGSWASWRDVLSPLGESCGASWKPLGRLGSRLGGILAGPGAVFGGPEGILGRAWGVPGGSWERRGDSGGSWGRLGGSLGGLGTL